MAKTCVPLTDEKLIQTAAGEKPRKLFDGGGLYVEVSPAGTKIWRMKFIDANGKESRLTFGPYPEVSLEHARSHRAQVRHLLDQGIDPRGDVNSETLHYPTRVGERRLLPLCIDKTRVARCTSRVGWAAVDQIMASVFPAIERMSSAGVSRDDISALVVQIRKEHCGELIRLLHDVCVEVVWGCLDLGVEDDDLIESMTDARVKQRRLG
ncbi:Arm DNA-binding domain-containing protein [Massilia sp. PWRC2]|uniref:Arm DNA-binding domain-containing protein n=1 Tax=Massilia sp. PWRC2 TaxID=2804626 RepID=UPI003CEC9079